MSEHLHVLFVENSMDDTELVLRVLRGGGFDPIFERVETAESMGAALDRGGWEIVLCDYVMPEFSALAALALLREADPDLPFIIVSGSIGEETAIEAMKQGANDYIMKDNPSRLAAAIRRELRDASLRRERRNAVELLRQSDERFRAIATSARDAIVLMDQEGMITLWNKSAERVFGFSSEEAEGKELHKLIVPERYFQAFSKGFKGFTETGQGAVVGSTIEVEGTRKDGTEFPLELSISSAKLDGNWNAVGIIRDISERKRAEGEKLRLATAVEQSSESIVITDAEGTILYVNPSFELVSGYTSDELIGQNSRILKGGQQNEEFYRDLWETISSGETWRGVFTNKAKNGTLYQEEANISPIREPSGSISSYIGVKHNITEQRRAEKELLESEKRFRLLIEGSIQGILVHRFMKPLFANQAFAEMFGYDSVGQIIELDDITNIIAQEDRQRLKKFHLGCMEGEDVPLRYDFKGVQIDGTSIWVETINTLIDWQGEPATLVAFNDITERRLLEEQLRQSQKMEAVGTLAGGIAHDFNNILSIILSYSGFLREHFEEGSPLRNDVEVIRKASHRAASLTRQLLAFSRRQTMQLENFDLNEVVQNVEKVLSRLIGETIVLETRLGENLGQIHADRGQIDQVLMNLVVNARDAMPKGGRVTIETAGVDVNEKGGHWPENTPAGRYILLTVSDTGIGMDEKTMSQVFEPFFTTKEVGKGTGLGLSTVYGIVKQMSGHLWTSSEPGVGTKFTIFLPRLEPAETDEQPRPRGGLETLGGSETILLVEDEWPVRDAVRRILEKGGYKILEATNGREAMQLFEERWEEIDIILSDVVMPEMSGGELAERVQALVPGFGILFMSGYTDETTAAHDLLGNDSSLLQKPFSEQLLLEKVREILEDHNGQT